jgi:hypothetical protein
MSYHHFPNMREMLQVDLSKKFTDGVESMDFKVRDLQLQRRQRARQVLVWRVLQNANHHLQDYLQDDKQDLHRQHATTL